jgi:hypothetical protein
MGTANNVYLVYILVPLFVLVSVGIPWVWRYWKRQQSKDWPMAPATFLDGKISLVQQPKRGANCDLTVWFSYNANGEPNDGCYQETFFNLDEAQQMLDSLKDGPLFVRFDPARPSKYFIDPYRDVRSQESMKEKAPES